MASSTHATAFCDRDFPAKNFEVKIYLAHNFERKVCKKSQPDVVNGDNLEKETEKRAN